MRRFAAPVSGSLCASAASCTDWSCTWTTSVQIRARMSRKRIRAPIVTPPQSTAAGAVRPCSASTAGATSVVSPSRAKRRKVSRAPGAGGTGSVKVRIEGCRAAAPQQA